MPFPSSSPELRFFHDASCLLFLIFHSIFHVSFAFYKELSVFHHLVSSHPDLCRVLYSIHQALSRTQANLSFLLNNRILQEDLILLTRTFRTQHRRNFRP